MNELGLEQPLDDVIDRIVDGSLSPGELCLALMRLERELDGWKRCTLAFLEAQCWRDAFRALEAPSESGASRERESTQPAGATFVQPRVHWWRSAAAAAIIAASFVLGWLSHMSRPRQESGSVLPVSSSPIVAAQPHDSPSEPVIPASDGPPRPIHADRRFVALRSPTNEGEIVRTVAQVRIGPEDSGATVPILAGPGINGDWLEATPPPLSEHEQVVLQRHGYQVDLRRRLLIATLADGRRVCVPIDQVQIRNTGSHPL